MNRNINIDKEAMVSARKVLGVAGGVDTNFTEYFLAFRESYNVTTDG